VFAAFAAVFLVLSLPAAQAYTIINSDITTTTTWNLAGSPYWVQGTITLQAGVTLYIDPGVVVKFQAGSGYNYVCKKLIIAGTLSLPASGNPVIFTSDRDDAADGQDTNGDGAATVGQAGNWGYLQFTNGGNILRNAIIRYGGIGQYTQSTPINKYMIWSAGVNTTIQNCQITNAYETAIYYQAPTTAASSPSITNNTISACAYALTLVPATSYTTSPSITGNTITATDYGVRIAGGAALPPVITLSSNNISSPDTTGYGVYFTYPANTSVISGNNIHHLLQGLILEDGSPSVTTNTLQYCGEFPLTQINTCFPTYTGNTINSNVKHAIRAYGTISGNGTWLNVQSLNMPYHIEDGSLTISAGATLTVNAGVVVKFEATGGYNVVNRSLHVYGTLALPASGNPVVFTSDRDDTAWGDSNGDGTGSSPGAGNWGYIRYYVNGNTLRNSHIRYGGIGNYSQSTPVNKYMVWVGGVTTTIQNCTMSYAYDLTVYYIAESAVATSPSITGNTINNAPYGIYMVPSTSYLTSPTISNNNISATGYGVKIEGGAAMPFRLTMSTNTVASPAGTSTGVWLIYPAATSSLTGNTITNNLQGLVMDNGSPAVSSNIFTNNAEFPLSQINDCFPTYSGNTISGNYKQAIRVYGTISITGTWPNVQNLGLPYHLEDGSLTISATGNLTINNGVVVKVEATGGYNIVNRSIFIAGILNLPSTTPKVTFTSDRDDTVGGDSNGDGTATSPGAGNWGYLRYQAGGNTLRNAVIRYGGIGNYSQSTPVNKYMVWIEGVTTPIRTCEMTDAYETTVYYVAVAGATSAPVIENNIINNCPYGISFYPSTAFVTSPTISGNAVSASGHGIYVNGNTAARPACTITGNDVTSPAGTGNGMHLINLTNTSTVANNTVDYALQGIVFDNCSPAVSNNTLSENMEFPLSQLNTSFPVYSGNIIADNEKQAIRVNGTIASNGTWVDVQNLGLPYHIEDGSITINAGATLSIDPGVIVKVEATGGYNVVNRSIHVDGILQSLGQAWNKVIFTSDRDDTVGGDSNGDGTATTPAAGNWGYIKFNNAANVPRNMLVRYGGIGNYQQSTPVNKYMMWMNGISTTVQDCIFDQAYETALYYVANTTVHSTAIVYHNRFTNCQFGLNFVGAAAFNTTLDAAFNYVSVGTSATNNYGMYVTQVASTSTIRYNNITTNKWGVHVYGAHGAFNIDHNNFTGNSLYGVRCLAAPCVVAPANWWGANNGPLDNETGAGACDGVNPGSGNRVSEYVDVPDWTQQPVPIGLLDCSAAMSVTCGQTLNYQGTDTGYQDVDVYACAPSWDESGKERVYMITTTSAGSLQVHLTPLFNTDPDVFILSTCSEEQCLAFGDTDAILASAAPGTYYVVVDSPLTPAYYNISFFCSQPTFTPTATPLPSSTPTPLPLLNCSNPVALTCGGTYNGNNTGGASNVGYYNCMPFNCSGPEIVHSLTTTSAGDITVTMSTSGNLACLFLTACSENACSNWTLDTMTLTNMPAGTYYIVVDGILGATSTYSITTTCQGGSTSPTPTPTYSNTPTRTPTGAYTPTVTLTPTITPTTGATYTPTFTPTTTSGTPTATPTGGGPTATPAPIPAAGNVGLTVLVLALGAFMLLRRKN